MHIQFGTGMKKQLKICYVYYDYSNVVPIHSHEVITQLAKKGNDVCVFCHIKSDSEVLKEWQRLDIRVVNVSSLPIRFVDEISFLIKLFFMMVLYISKLRSDMIYVRHGSSSLICVIVGKLLKVPVCLEVNDILTKRMVFKGIYFFKKLWIELYEWFSFTLADRIFPVTDGINKWICNKYRVRRECVITVPNGVNDHRFYPAETYKCREQYDLTDRTLIVGYLGSLFPWAGLECLIEAVPSIVSVYPSVLFIIGGGEEPHYSMLKKKVEDNNLSSHVVFFGRVEWEDAKTFINTTDLCIAPAFFDNLESGISSQKLLAYLACGKPVVGSDIPGLGDMLEKERIGVSFRMGDPVELSKTINSLLADSYRLKEMGKRARSFVVKNYTWNGIVDRLIDMFKELI